LPLILGSELSGIVEAIGPEVSGFKPGEEVYGATNELHYSRVFSNSYCRAYVVSLGRLEETKPVILEHDSVSMTLGASPNRLGAGALSTKKA